MPRLPVLVAALAACATPLCAHRVNSRDITRDDARFSFYDRGPYRSSVPRPDSLLGYAVGDAGTQYAQQERTRGTNLLIDEPTGRGHVVLFTNEPKFRGWWHALDKLVMNAMLLGPAS